MSRPVRTPCGGPAATLPVGVLAGAVALFATAGDSHAQSRIARLFSSPEQRVELDRLREDSRAGEVAEPIHDGTGQESRLAPERGTPALAATFDGIATRSDGHRVAWIDGVETAVGGSTPAGIRVETARTPGGRLGIRASVGRTSAVLEPGQSIDADGRVRNAYERRSRAVAAGTSGERSTDAGGEHADGDATAEPSEPDSRSLPATLVQDLLRRTRADSAP